MVRLLKVLSNRLKQKPFQVLADVREFLLFKWTGFLLKLFVPKGVLLGKNVRVEKLRCLSNDSFSGKMTVGNHSIIYENARLVTLSGGEIEIGAYSILGDTQIFSRKKIKIGTHFLSSWNVFIQDYDAHPTSAILRKKQVQQMCAPKLGIKEEIPFNFNAQEIVIGDNVWVGSNVTIFKGAHIGNHCVLAAGAIILKGHYPDYSIIAGNPAKVVKTISPSFQNNSD